jgi:drug/metabolite transporter (DMT)-like permease
VTYLVPLFSTVLGVAVLSEGLSWNQPVGAAVVLVGVALTQGRLSRPTT